MSLPEYSSPLVGRASDVRYAVRALEHGRCVVLHGPGGIGKSRVAVAAAAEYQALTGARAYFLPLDVQADGPSLLPALAAILGLEVADEAGLHHAIVHFLTEQSTVLLVDGFEAAVDARDELMQLLADCPHLRVLVTCRFDPALPRARVFVLHGLPTRAPGDEISPAEALFVHAARSVKPAFELDAETRHALAELCALVGGLPLAIELAAYWVTLLPVRFIVQHLKHDLEWLTDVRHLTHEQPRSIQAVFDYFWERLSAEQRRALCRLSIFEGGFDEAAAVALADVSHAYLAQLSDGFFVRPIGVGRYALHALMRQYLQPRFAVLDREAGRYLTRYVAYYHDRARRLRAQMESAPNAELARSVTDDFANTRAALLHAVRTADTRSAFGIVASAVPFWAQAGRGPEVRELVSKAVALEASTVPDVERCRAHAAAGEMLEVLGDLAAARAQVHAAFVLASQRGLHEQLTSAACALSVAERRLGALAQALRYSDTAIDSAGQVGRPALLAAALRTKAMALLDLARLDDARVTAERAMTVARAAGDASALAYAANDYALVLIDSGDRERALEALQQALALNRKAQHRSAVAVNLQNLGWLAFDAQDYAQAERYFREALREAERLGMEALVTHIRTNLGRVKLGLGESGIDECALALAGALRLRSNRQMTNVLQVIADELLRRGDTTRGLRAIAAAWASPACSADVRAYLDNHLARLAEHMAQAEIEAVLGAVGADDLEPVARETLAYITTASAVESAP